MFEEAVNVYRNQGAATFAKKSAQHLYRRLDDRSLSVTNRWFDAKYGSGTSVLERDWDNLLLYDACRYDKFLRVSPFPDDVVKRRVTVGSKTPEFLQKTFDGETCHDIVYITANPQPLKYDYGREDNPFHAVISLLDKWDLNTQTVLPEDVIRETLRIESEFPEKRLIVHFLQPHAPFLGPTAKKIREQTGQTIGGLDPGREYTDIDSKSIKTGSYRSVLREHGNVSIEDIRTAYHETLAISTNYVVGLVGKLDGKSVITSDHGELLGDRLHPLGVRRWEHPFGVRSKELCLVPWVECPTDGRKVTRADTPNDQLDIDESTVDDRLRSLGYIS